MISNYHLLSATHFEVNENFLALYERALWLRSVVEEGLYINRHCSEWQVSRNYKVEVVVQRHLWTSEWESVVNDKAVTLQSTLLTILD